MVKRYSPDMQEDPNGKWVKYEPTFDELSREFLDAITVLKDKILGDNKNFFMDRWLSPGYTLNVKLELNGCTTAGAYNKQDMLEEGPKNLARDLMSVFLERVLCDD